MSPSAIDKGSLLPYTILTLLIVAAVLAIWLAIQNRGMSSVLTATATLIAGISFYILNTMVTLKASKQTVSLPVEITVDRSNKFIGAHVYSVKQSQRSHV